MKNMTKAITDNFKIFIYFILYINKITINNINKNIF